MMLYALQIFWKMLFYQFIKWGFVINLQDSCVANKMIAEKQCSIVCHVDDLKISHQDKNIVDHVINLLEWEFSKESPLTKD